MSSFTVTPLIELQYKHHEPLFEAAASTRCDSSCVDTDSDSEPLIDTTREPLASFFVTTTFAGQQKFSPAGVHTLGWISLPQSASVMEHLAYALGLDVCDMHMFQLLVGGHLFLQPEVLRAGDVHGCKLMLQGKLLGAGDKRRRMMIWTRISIIVCLVRWRHISKTYALFCSMKIWQT